MDTTATLDMARKLAATAKPGFLKINGKKYTFCFNQSQWVYDVYEDMVFLHSYNTKRLSVAKQWLRDYLNN